MNEKDFFKEVSARLEENEKLGHGGLPNGLKGWGSIVGLYPWQSLLLLSFVLTLIFFYYMNHSLIFFVERLLLIK